VRFVDPLGLRRTPTTLPDVPGNCLSYALGIAIDPTTDNGLGFGHDWWNGDPNWPLSYMPLRACTPIPCDANVGCKKKRRKIAIFIDLNDRSNWHAMRQLCNGQWVSKNGSEPPVTVSGSPIQFYINEFHPGNIQMTCWSCPWPPAAYTGGFDDQ